jgi:DNA-binding MarR family transcriptional regulator
VPTDVPGDRPDLAALLTRAARVLIALERPILAAHDLSMWGYIVLSALRDEPVRAQAALARAIGADKTRLIPVLDELQQRGLIDRTPDPVDRRVHLLTLTAAGRRLHGTVQRAIRAEENKLLGGLPAADQRGLLRSLQAIDPAAE